MELASRGGDIEEKVQGPLQQLGQCPDGSGTAEGLESPHASRVSLSDNFLIIAVGAFPGAASPLEVMPRL